MFHVHSISSVSTLISMKSPVLGKDTSESEKPLTSGMTQEVT